MTTPSAETIHRWRNPDYAKRRLAEIKTRHYPNGDTLQMIADFDWLIEETEYLRDALAKVPRW